MSKPGKRFRTAADAIEAEKLYGIEDAVKLIKSGAKTKFDETIEIAMNLGVDPRHSDQMIRSTVSLPHGIGKVVKVLVLCKEERVQEALDAGADFAGLDEYVDKIKEGWLEVEHKRRRQKFLYPRQASSLYHTTKIMDTDLLWFYVRTWDLRVTDLMQGPVYGLFTDQTENDEQLLTIVLPDSGNK